MQEFNKLLSENRYKLKILGDWTVKYILENKGELLLSKKYNCYDIGRIALEKFYKFAGVAVPEWLTRWVTDTALEELDVDEESVIRSILSDNTHKTIQNNARVLEMENKGMKITLDQRIQLCLDNELWSWIRKTKEDGKYYIDGSILELFTYRLPELTLKKLGEKMNVKYSGHLWKTCINMLKSRDNNFITGEFYIRTWHHREVLERCHQVTMISMVT